MDLSELDSFKVLKERVQNIDEKMMKIERELLCPSLFGDPIKASASEEFVDKRIEEVINIKENIKKLIEETRQSLDMQKKFNEQLSTTKYSLIQRLKETESHLQKFGYEPSQKDCGDLLPPKEEDSCESCDDSKKNNESSSISDEDVVTRDFEDLSLSYKECLTPFVSVQQSRSYSKVSSNKQCVARKLVDDESIVYQNASNNTVTPSGFKEACGYSEAYYELERKYKMYKKQSADKV